MNTIRITNPEQGGSSYTSMRKAADFVRRERAVVENGCLRFLHRDDLSRRESEGNALFWNGNRHPWLMHKPGEVRS